MKNALIDPVSSVSHVVSWTTTKPTSPVYEQYPNSARICEIADTSFEVGQPLFWVACADDVVADQFYYDTATTEILPAVNVSYGTSGTQTL